MIEIRAHMQPWFDGIELFIRKDKQAMAAPLTFKDHEPGMVSDPALRISGDEGQQLMDELWRCGLRPSEGSGSAGSLAATERHLEDMRALVAQKIGKLPGVTP